MRNAHVAYPSISQAHGRTKQDFFGVLYTINIVVTLVDWFFIAGQRLRDCPTHLISLTVIIIVIIGACGLSIAILSIIVYFIALAFFNITRNEMTWTVVNHFIPCCSSHSTVWATS
jgi:uncharacterized membrane protein YhaH (DUF805 family)